MFLKCFKKNCATGCPCDDYACDVESSTTSATATTTATTTTTAAAPPKSVLVLSTYVGEQQPLVIHFNGKHKL